MTNRDKFYAYIAVLGCVALGFLASRPAEPFPSDRDKPAPAIKPVGPWTDPYLAYELIDAHNAERATHGAGPLEPDLRLIAAARKHAEHMAARGRMAHSGIGDGSPGDRTGKEGFPGQTIGENVACSYLDLSAAMRGWMWSPGHRMNILSSSYTHMGAAVAFSRTGEPYWCAVFGRPAN